MPQDFGKMRTVNLARRLKQTIIFVVIAFQVYSLTTFGGVVAFSITHTPASTFTKPCHHPVHSAIGVVKRAAPVSSSSTALSAVTVDPTSVLSDTLGGVVNTPLILAVPIVVALAVGSLLAYFLVSSAAPEASDDAD
jgi:hypothetical protein